MECDKEMDTTTPGDNNNNYKNNKFELANPKNILMSTQLELFITTPICTKRAQMVITYSKGRRQTSFHPSVSSSIHPFVRSSIRPIMVCLLRQGGERVEYRHDAVENNIY